MSVTASSRGRRAALFAASCAATALALGACSSGAGTSGTGGSGTGKGASPDVVAEARAWVAATSKPPAWPVPTTPLAKPADMKGKTVMLIPLSDKIPLMHGIAVAMQQALSALGGKGVICDGGANPSQMADCLKSAGDEKVSAAVTLFMDYEPLANAIDALTAKGIPVLVAGVAPSPHKPAGGKLAYADDTPFINKGYENAPLEAFAVQGAHTNILWARLLDSSLTRGFSDAGVARFKALCPACGITTVDFTTSSLDKLPTAISAALTSHPDTNVVFVPPDSFVPPALQGIQAAGFASKVKVISNGADPGGLERVAAGTEAMTMGFSVEFEGWRMTNSLMQFLSGEPVTPVTQEATRVFTPQVVKTLNTKPANYFTTAWFGGDSFKADFLKIWGRS